MRYSSLTLLAAGLGSAAAAEPLCGDPPAALSKMLPNVLIVGDSVSMGSSGYSRYVAAMLNRPNYQIAQVQHSGGFGAGGQADDTKNGIACIDHWLGGLKWDAITVNFGLHDVVHDTPSEYSANLKTILTKVKNASNAALYITTTPNGGTFHPQKIVQYNKLAREVTKELGVPVVDLNAYVHAYCGEKYTLCPIQLDSNIHFTTRPPHPSGQQYTGLVITEALLHILPLPKTHQGTPPMLSAEENFAGPQPHSCGHSPAPLSKDRPNVLIIGDSISGDALGYGPLVRDILELRNGPVGLPNGSLASVQHNGGWTKDGVSPLDQQAGPTTNGVYCVKHWLGTEKWNVISFNFGIHDCEKGSAEYTDAQTYSKNLEFIAKTLKAGLAPGGTLIWTSTTPPPYPKSTDNASVLCVNERNAIAKDVLAKFDVHINDLHTEFNEICGTNFTSCSLQLAHHNVHPTLVGRQYLAIKTATVIAPLLNLHKNSSKMQGAVEDGMLSSQLETPNIVVI